MSGLSFLSPSVLLYIFVQVFLDTLPKVLLNFHFFVVLVSSSVFSVSMYEVLLFSLYRNLSLSSFLLSYRCGSFTSTCRTYTGEVLKAPAHILMPSLSMQSRFFQLPAETVLYSWQP